LILEEYGTVNWCLLLGKTAETLLNTGVLQYTYTTKDRNAACARFAVPLDDKTWQSFRLQCGFAHWPPD